MKKKKKNLGLALTQNQNAVKKVKNLQKDLKCDPTEARSQDLQCVRLT